MPDGGVTGKGFVKGDVRINRKGRPKSFDKLRELAQSIAHEEARTSGSKDANGNIIPGNPIVIDGHIATIAEMMLRQWAQSKDPRFAIAFMEYAYGKAPLKQENYNIDLDSLTPDELERIANGEDPARVLKSHSATSGS